LNATGRLSWGKEKMKLSAGMLVAVLVLGGVGAGHATVRITDDQGGRIGDYLDKYQRLRDAGELIVVDGVCLGACTIMLATMQRDRICLTSNAKFGFRAAWDIGSNGQRVTNHQATELLYSMFPLEIKHWIAQQGGLTPETIILQGDELQRLYRLCPGDAHVIDLGDHHG
jgi:hypothetical protein